MLTIETTFTRCTMDSPKKKRKETGQHFATKKPRLHEEAINRYQMLNAEKAQEKARKTNAPKLPWTKAEDETLTKLVDIHVEIMGDPKKVKWTTIAQSMGILRSGKQCRERWYQHLRPGLVKGNWTAEEDALVKELHEKHGNRWAKIAEGLPHRTDNDIKNRWNSKKKSERIKARWNSSVAKKPGRRDKKTTRKSPGEGVKATHSKGISVSETPHNIMKTSVRLATTSTTAINISGKNRKATHPYGRISSETPHSFTFILGNDDAYGLVPLEATPHLWSGFKYKQSVVLSPFVPLDAFSCTPLQTLFEL